MVRHVWRFGYGSNIGLTTLRQKKNLNPIKYQAGTIQGYELYFTKGIPYVEPGFAGVRPNANNELHGSAFYIPQDEADGLDKQEGSYDVVPCQFVSYDGEMIENVGLYVPKKKRSKSEPSTQQKHDEGIPSRRYLRLLQNGAREAPLSKDWIDKLDSFEYYITPPEIRQHTLDKIDEFQKDPERKDLFWTSEKLSKFDGSSADFPAHTSIMEYVLELGPNVWVFSSWKGHSVTRRNLLQVNGKSVDAGDIRYGEEGYRPFPKMKDCTEEEREYLFQNLDSVIQRGGRIVARLQDFLEDQEDKTSSHCVLN